MPAYPTHVVAHTSQSWQPRDYKREISWHSATNYNVLLANGGFAGVQSMNESDEGREFSLRLRDRMIRRRGERREDEMR